MKPSEVNQFSKFMNIIYPPLRFKEKASCRIPDSLSKKENAQTQGVQHSHLSY